MIPALIFQYFVLFILGIAGLVAMFYNLYVYIDLLDKEETDDESC